MIQEQYGLAQYQYHLPEERIARYPLKVRDESRLLVWKEGNLVHSRFRQLAEFLPVNSTLFFNNTKVIPARLLFHKQTGGTIEVFLLHPADNRLSMGEGLASSSPVTWQCTVGNERRWPPGMSLEMLCEGITLHATFTDRSSGLVTLSWKPEATPFATVIAAAGAVPLPPYLKRPAEEADRERYQTIYSKHDGAVAAPTAGLHFTQEVFGSLKLSGVRVEYLTLHVSAGTFLPIKSDDVTRHRMHEEQILISRSNVVRLLQKNGPIIAVGTTALRTLESIYWYGAMLASKPGSHFAVPQDLPYSLQNLEIPVQVSLKQVLDKMDREGKSELTGATSIYVIPGYKFRLTEGLITNFHQPGSSLLVLVSAFVGQAWREIYQEALKSDYRFLSFGDSTLLLPGESGN